MMNKRLISIVTPTYNEIDNIKELYARITSSIVKLRNNYEFEVICIDNASTDGTVGLLKEMAQEDKSFKVILNRRNFGHIRSPYYGILQASGDAVIYLASDLQDPPELIPRFIAEWEQGYKLIMATKPASKDNKALFRLRKAYYDILDSMSEVSIVKDSTGFGLYDREVLDHIKEINDPYPFLRGLICELGYEVKAIPFTQPKRIRGISKNNFYSLYDIAMLGLISHSKVPMRIAAFSGFIVGLMSIIAASIYALLKVVFWSSIPIGVAPILIGVFFLIGMTMVMIGVLGEYVASIHIYIQNRPIVVEKARINF